MISYPIFMEDKKVGTAQIRKEGMYYIVSCSCGSVPQKQCRVRFTGPKGAVDLGLLVPEQGGHRLVKRVVAKAVDLDEGRFALWSGKETEYQRAETGMRITHPEKLEQARVCLRDGQLWLYYSG